MRFKIKKITVRIGIGLLAFIALALLARTVLNFTTGRRLTNTLREYRERGVPLAMKELEPDCEPEENAALHWKAAEALFTVRPEQRDLLRDAITAVTELRPLEESVQSRLEDLIAAQGDYFRQVRAASEKACFKYEEDWSRFTWEFRHPDAVKKIQGTRLLALAACLEARRDRTDEALARCRDGLRLLELQLSSPFLLDYLVNIACGKILAAAWREIALSSDPGEAALAETIDRFDPGPWRRGLAAAISGERIWAGDTANPGFLTQGPETRRNRRFFLWLLRPLYKAETVWLLEFHDRLQEIVDRPYNRILDGEGAFIAPFPSPPGIYKTAGQILPNWAPVVLKRASLAAIFDTIRLGAACRLYRLRHGDWPEDLERLVPEILGELPLDPFTGGPYVYRREGAGFLVYSLGSNRRDDGGRETWMIPHQIMPADDDWTWRQTGSGPETRAVH